MTIKRLPVDLLADSPRERAYGQRAVFIQLSVMMLLEFVVFGAWFATLGLVLHSQGWAAYIGPTYLLCAIAAMVSPLCLGALADRFMESQRVLALAHMLGAVALVTLPKIIEAHSIEVFLALIFVYMLLFMPTLGLVNSISLRHLGESRMSFAYIRVFAPLGWVLSGLCIGWAGLSASTSIFTVAAASSLLLGIYALFLPATPPPMRGGRISLGDLVGAKAFSLFRNRNFTVLLVCSLLTAVSLGIYNAFSAAYLSALGITNVAGTLGLGQLSEVVFIATIPFVLSKIGMKWTLLVGIGMWAVRFLLFCMAPEHGNGLAVVGVALHGICNDFCVVIAAMYIDRLAPAHLAAQAQSWVILVFSGVGAAIGSIISGTVYGHYVAPNIASGNEAWIVMWAVPIAVVIVNMLIWIFMFNDKEVAQG
ncbi:MFS transporter [Pseudomonas plecoglossicida]|nr:MFS transporter [Pseudomonas sp. 165]MDM1714508.1 MFS transporter [Pseudomonas sp. 165]MDQ7967622.1 MFS transporter [Pseudomonas plecoglossicida]